MMILFIITAFLFSHDTALTSSFCLHQFESFFLMGQLVEFWYFSEKALVSKLSTSLVVELCFWNWHRHLGKTEVVWQKRQSCTGSLQSLIPKHHFLLELWRQIKPIETWNLHSRVDIAESELWFHCLCKKGENRRNYKYECNQ